MLFSSLALRVVIDISYTPPEPGYQPPYYRAASGVTLTCRAVGVSGQIRYYWSSTCSSCFVPGGSYYSYSGHSRSQSFLVTRDAGTHTCSAYDSSQGISASTSIVMNIVGEYLLVADIKIMTDTYIHTSYNCPNPPIEFKYQSGTYVLICRVCREASQEAIALTGKNQQR